MSRPQQITKEVWGRMLGLLFGGFGFVAALAWNDAVQSLFAEFFDPKTAGVLVKFIYAAVVTLAITLVSLKLSKYSGQDSNDKLST